MPKPFIWIFICLLSVILLSVFTLLSIFVVLFPAFFISISICFFIKSMCSLLYPISLSISASFWANFSSKIWSFSANFSSFFAITSMVVLLSLKNRTPLYSSKMLTCSLIGIFQTEDSPETKEASWHHRRAKARDQGSLRSVRHWRQWQHRPEGAQGRHARTRFRAKERRDQENDRRRRHQRLWRHWL